VAIERFQAYARGVIEGGAVAEFFRHELPRIRLDPGAIRNALARRAPDPEEVLFAELRQALSAVERGAEAELAVAETDAATHRLLREERLEHPLAALREAVAALGAE